MTNTTPSLYYQTMYNPLTRPVKYARGKHPNTLNSLRPHQYKPGENGHGRVYPLKERLYHALDHPLKEPKPDAPHGDVIVYNTLKGAAELVPAPFHEVWDRVEGRLQDTPPPSQDNRQINYVFVLPNGTKVSPKALIDYANSDR